MSNIKYVFFANCFFLSLCIIFLILGILETVKYSSREKWNKETIETTCLVRNVSFRERYCDNILCWTPVLDLKYNDNVKNVSINENILVYDNIQYYRDKYKPDSNIKCYYNKGIFLTLYHLDNANILFFFLIAGGFLIVDIIISISIWKFMS